MFRPGNVVLQIPNIRHAARGPRATVRISGDARKCSGCIPPRAAGSERNDFDALGFKAAAFCRGGGIRLAFH